MKKINFFCLLSILIYYGYPSYCQELINPSFEEVISLRSISNAQISPDGQNIVFELNSTDWKENRYDTEIWISKNGQSPFPLTNHPTGSSYNPQWSPDGEWIAFISKRGDKNQIQVIRFSGGEAFQLTHSTQEINRFEWSPDGKMIAFLQAEDRTEIDKKRSEKYGGFAIDDKEYNLMRLWLIDFVPERLALSWLPQQMLDSSFIKLHEPKPLLDSVDFTINNFKWSPDGTKIAIGHQPDPLINTFFKADISILDLQTMEVSVLVDNPSADGLIDWSPDGSAIIYTSDLDDTTSNYYMNNHLFRINLDEGKSLQLASDFDENIYNLHWTPEGIYGIAWQKTKRLVVKIDPNTGQAFVIDPGVERVYNLSFSKDGKYVTYTGANDEDLVEVYRSGIRMNKPEKLSNFSEQIIDWSFAKSEVITWESEDGQIVEGVLHKPINYDPTIKYPLLVIIHGGPTGISTPQPTPSYVYPIIQWLNKGALVLRPNYRGSAGYGEKFRSLNVKNLGVGDAWDVLSGVEYLVEKGMVDPNRTGCMGWSQGGYISAFLTTHSNKFKAISVGAGISNWMTYYVNTDIHPFTRQYLKATPWSDEEIYEKTSPMSAIKNASTPTLIQHGEYDKRVPTANAYELLQGLRDVGVETTLIIYKGFGHGISKPKERLAATWHNWQWFGKYIWGEDIVIPE